MPVRWRTVQAAPDKSAPLCVLYLVGQHLDPDLRSALPDCAIVASVDSGVDTTSSTLAQARTLAGSGDSPLVLVGYSAGCQGVRKHLVDGVEPVAVVAIDGTHGSMPPAAWQINVWRDAMARARDGVALFIGTCTQQGYTERLPAGQRFASTRTILEAASGATLGAGQEHHENGLHLLGYASASIDGPAHIRQQREVLPETLRRYVAPWLSGLADSAPLSGERPKLALGLAALEIARSQIGVRETTGKNDGQQIARYFAGCTRRRDDGREAATGWASGWDWCAAFASWCAYEATGQASSKPPHGRRIAVWELVRDAREANAWEDSSAWGTGPRPGDLVIWRRSGDPRIQGQTGHVSRCVAWDGSKLVTIGGNEENRVREADVSADLARAIGVIRYQ